MSAFLRFVIVGCCNTCIDMVLTNLGVWWFHPQNTVTLFSISLCAALVATCNSFILNKKWTFAGSSTQQATIVRFFAVAICAMLINSTTFSFVAAALAKRTLAPALLIINGAKLLGIGAAVSFSFLGQRFCVFKSERSALFKNSFHFPAPAHISLPFVWTLFFVSLAIRALFLGFSGHSFSLELLTYSIVPSVLIAPLIYIYASFLTGSSLAFAMALTMALHPRLVEYSCLGIDAFSLPLLLIVCIALQANKIALFLVGSCATCLVRPEFVVFSIFLALWHFRKRYLSVTMGALVCSLSTLLYAGTKWFSCASTTAQFASVLPQAVLSPLPLFALLLPLTVKSYPRPVELIILLLVAGGYYPWVFSYAHDLMPLLIPLHVFGILGLYALTCYVFKKPHKAFIITVGMLCTLFVGLSLFRAFELAH